MPDDSLDPQGRSGAAAQGGDDVDLRRLWQVVTSSWRLVAGITLLFVLGGVAYLLLTKPSFRAETVLMPVSAGSASTALAQFGQISALAGLAGLNLGQSESVEPLAILQSKRYLRDFILEHDLLPVLFAEKWDAGNETWLVPPDEQPDIRDAVALFDKRVRKVREDKKTGLVTVSVQWTDPALAANWANQLARGVDEPMRKRVITETSNNIAYLEEQMKATDVVAMQEAIGRLLEGEMQKLMVAQGRQEFAFRIVDEAQVPKNSVWPKKSIVLLFSGFLGVGVSLFIVLVRDLLGR